MQVEESSENKPGAGAAAFALVGCCSDILWWALCSPVPQKGIQGSVKDSQVL